MLKINSVIPRNVKRYTLKNTVNARYERAKDFITFSSLGLAIEHLRFPVWQIEDITITAMAVTIAVKSFIELVKNRIALQPIIKRAKKIKSAPKY